MPLQRLRLARYRVVDAARAAAREGHVRGVRQRPADMGADGTCTKNKSAAGARQRGAARRGAARSLKSQKLCDDRSTRALREASQGMLLPVAASAIC